MKIPPCHPLLLGMIMWPIVNRSDKCCLLFKAVKRQWPYLQFLLPCLSNQGISLVLRWLCQRSTVVWIAESSRGGSCLWCPHCVWARNILCWLSHWDAWSCYCSISKLNLTNTWVIKSASSFSWVLSQIAFPSLPWLWGWVLANGLSRSHAWSPWLEMVKRGTAFSHLFPFLPMTMTPRK